MIANVHPKSLGKLGEEAAERYLHGKGYKILATNYRLRGGEIDLIAKDAQAIVFVEVKTRVSQTHGEAVQAVTAHKRDQISKTAMTFLQNHGYKNYLCRFDVIAIHVQGKKARLTHFKNAFPLSEKYSF